MAKQSRFHIFYNQLPDYIKDAIFVIQSLHKNISFQFQHAEDWTNQLQGWVLYFTCKDCYEVFADQDRLEFTIKAQFCHNPSLKIVEEDTSDFQSLEYKGNNLFAVYLTN